MWDRLRKSKRLFVIAGPCVIESLELCLRIGRKLKNLTETLDMDFVFKASFDKANRTSTRSFRGPGLEEGVSILREVRQRLGVPVLTDVHDLPQVQSVANAVDILQIPAFLCRQTDLVVGAAETGAILNIKKGQFLAPDDIQHVVDKVESSGNEMLLLTERGTTFGYNNLVADMRSIAMMGAYGKPIIFDATHSVQMPGAGGQVSGGRGDLAPTLARAAVAAGANGIFFETHPDPSKALSDGPNMIPLHKVGKELKVWSKLFDAVNERRKGRLP